MINWGVPDIVIPAVTAIAYAALALHFWNSRWRTASAAPGLRSWERAALLAPIALHGALLYAGLFVPAELRFGFAYALSAMLWLAVLLYWVEGFFYHLEGMLPLALLLAALAAPLPVLFPGSVIGTYAAAFGFKLHLAVAMLAYSLFVIAVLHVVLMAVMEKRLHAKAQPRALASLPPLLTLERLLFRVIGAAFVLLTITIATGIGFSEQLFGRPFRFDHKTVFALLSWLTFAVLLGGRLWRGWRGRTALRWTMSGFLMLVLAYVGSRFVLEVILHRA